LGRSTGSWELAALTRGFFSFPPQDPTDGQKKELLKGIEAYEDDKGHQQYRITKVEVRRGHAQRSGTTMLFMPFGQPLRARSVATCIASLACVSSEDFSEQLLWRRLCIHVPSWRAAQSLARALGWSGRPRGTPCCRPAPRASAA